MYQLYAKIGNKYGILKLKLLKRCHLAILISDLLDLKLISSLLPLWESILMSVGLFPKALIRKVKMIYIIFTLLLYKYVCSLEY